MARVDARHRAFPVTKPNEPFFVAGVEVVPYAYAYDRDNGPLWLTDGGGIGIDRVGGPDGWGIVYRPHPDRISDEDDVLISLQLEYIQRHYRNKRSAAQAAAELVSRLREVTEPTSGFQVRAGRARPWPRGNPSTGWK